jgi:PRTRC genetic system protein F
MLFDPSFNDRSVDADAAASWQPPGAAVARHRSSDCVLTLPDVDASVPGKATIKWRSEPSLDAIILEQFRHGPLRAGDVHDPVSPVDAFQQAFFAWAGRQLGGSLRMVSFGLELLDTNAVNDIVCHQYDRENFQPESPLHLGVALENEWVHEVGVRAQTLRDAHPLLLHTMFNLVDRVSWKTVPVRTPGWFLCEAACRHWDGDESASDEDAHDVLMQMYEDEEAVQRYLPSTLRPALCPDEVRSPSKVEGRRARSSMLSVNELRQLQRASSGFVSSVCSELIALQGLLRRAGKRELFDAGYEAHPLYSGCTLVLEHNERTSELLDDFLESEFSAGEASGFSRFINFSNTRHGIRSQYAEWGLGLQMLRRLDRLLALVVDPD